MIAATLCGSLVGCGGPSETHPVSGTVAFEDGTSIHVGMIEFLPVEGGPSARGAITRGGAYELTTREAGDGARAGEYVVLISQPQVIVGSVRDAPDEHRDTHHDGETLGAGIVPIAYGQRRSTPLRAAVSPGANRLDFRIETVPADGGG